MLAGWKVDRPLAAEARKPVTSTFAVVGTGVDPVTSRFSGGLGPISASPLTSGFGTKVQVRRYFWPPASDRHEP